MTESASPAACTGRVGAIHAAARARNAAARTHRLERNTEPAAWFRAPCTDTLLHRSAVSEIAFIRPSFPSPSLAAVAWLTGWCPPTSVCMCLPTSGFLLSARERLEVLDPNG